MEVFIELHYLPCLEYFVSILNADKIYIESNENYCKQTYRNRCKISGANKIEMLSIPVKHSSRKLLIKEVEIDYDQRWLTVHWRSICSAYGKSPFFLEYISEFEKIFFKKHKFLFDLNFELLTICLYFLQIKKELKTTEKYNKTLEYNQTDRRNTIIPLEKVNFEGSYKPYSYIQNFGKEFAPNLSVIDLLFSEGNHSVSILEMSHK